MSARSAGVYRFFHWVYDKPQGEVIGIHAFDELPCPLEDWAGRSSPVQPAQKDAACPYGITDCGCTKPHSNTQWCHGCRHWCIGGSCARVCPHPPATAREENPCGNCGHAGLSHFIGRGKCDLCDCKERVVTAKAESVKDANYDGDFCTPTMTVAGCSLHDPTVQKDAGRRWTVPMMDLDGDSLDGTSIVVVPLAELLAERERAGAEALADCARDWKRNLAAAEERERHSNECLITVSEQRDAALATLERVREAVRGHEECGDECSAMPSVLAALGQNWGLESR